MKQIKEILDKKIILILKEIITKGIPYLVGGCVRDLILDLPIKDLDIEVHGLTIEELEIILKKFGYVRLVGKQFGVLRIDSYDIDWSIPRRDSKGRKPKVEFDPGMGIKEAARRRDLTLNAIAINLKTFLTTGDQEFIDPYGGIEDIKHERLKAVDSVLFYDDPLRFYRVIQFISRFEMEPDEELTVICKKINVVDVARERIYDEFKKLLLRSRKPSLGLRYLKKISRLKELFPELGALVGIKQSEKYHPEGDAFEHTMQSLDASAVLELYEDESEKLLVMFAVLCHDLGKAKVNTQDGRAIGHEKEGVSLAGKFLKRFGVTGFLSNAISKMVYYHMMPFALLEQKSGLSAYKRLASKLSPEVTPKELGLVALCDHRGRNKNSFESLQNYKNEFDYYMQKVKDADVEYGPQKPVLLGRHLLDILDPGEKMGELLKKAYEIQIEEGILDWEELKRRVIAKKA